MKTVLTLILVLFLVGCGAGGSSPNELTIGDVAGDLQPGNENAPLDSVHSKWGHTATGLPLDFRNFVHNHGYVRLWNMYEDGYNQVSGREIRTCRDEMTIDGDDFNGTVTITNVTRGWSITPNVAELECENHAGVYEYQVTPNGLLFGKAGQAVLYQKLNY